MAGKKDTKKLDATTQRPTETPFKDVPLICLIDLDTADISLFQSHGFNYNSGTLGTEVQVPNNGRNDRHICLLNHSFPPNLHEHDIVVVNLQHHDMCPYDASEHTISSSTRSDAIVLMSEYPATVFNPRPYAATLLLKELRRVMSRTSILIIFMDSQDTVEYHPFSVTSSQTTRLEPFYRTTYDFLENLPDSENIKGTRSKVASIVSPELHALITKYSSGCTYATIFEHPTIWDNTGNKRIKKPTFIPLMFTSQGQIISYLDFEGQTLTLVFPIIKQRGHLLLDLFQGVLPDLVPELFPHSTRFAWLKNEPYLLPNEAKLLSEKRELETEYSAKILEADKRISDNRQAHAFLHDLITATSEKLVKSVETYFKWLGFTDVVNMDETNPDLKEEDLQILTDKGVVIVEVKGISGTSKDSDCSQISKIKFRRAKQRGNFDIFALYLVNHQRHLPPQDRADPPFTQQQIDDAINDERGLLTTHSLFKLYYHIEAGLITKADARKSLLQYGLVKFIPSNAIHIGRPIDVHYSGEVAILRIADIRVTKGDSLIVCDGEDFRQTTILDVRLDDKSVDSASNAEVGLKLDQRIGSNSEFWLVQT